MAITPIGNISQELFENARYTYLSAAVSASGESLTVQSINKFAVNQILFIGELGDEKSEIVKTHASTAPSGTTITLVSGGVTYDHPIDTKVYIIDYDQVVFYHSTST